MATLSDNRYLVVIIDDHDIVRKGIQLLINELPDFTFCGEASSNAEALALITRVRPDVAILDLDLGKDDGCDLIPLIRSNSPHTRILVLTGLRNTNTHREAVQAGAIGLVNKNQMLSVLTDALRKVALGEAWLDPALVANILNELSRAPQAASINPEISKIARLTEREHQVIQLICEGLQNRAIAGRLFISETTVRHHLTSIFTKLEVENRLELVVYAFQHNLTTPMDSC